MLTQQVSQPALVHFLAPFNNVLLILLVLLQRKKEKNSFELDQRGTYEIGQ